MKHIVLALVALLMIVSAGAGGYFLFLANDSTPNETENNPEDLPEPKAGKTAMDDRDAGEPERNHPDPKLLRRARKEALDDLERERKETLSGLQDIDKQRQARKERAASMAKWADK